MRLIGIAVIPDAPEEISSADCAAGYGRSASLLQVRQQDPDSTAIQEYMVAFHVEAIAFGGRKIGKIIHCTQHQTAAGSVDRIAKDRVGGWISGRQPATQTGSPGSNTHQISPVTLPAIWPTGDRSESGGEH